MLTCPSNETNAKLIDASYNRPDTNANTNDPTKSVSLHSILSFAFMVHIVLGLIFPRLIKNDILKSILASFVVLVL